MITHRPSITAFAISLGLAACASDGTSDTAAGQDGWAVSNVNTPDFENQVYPVLLRDCGFNTCHGSDQRFFRVWGPFRARLDPLTMPSDQKLLPEVTASRDIAMSMIDFDDPKRSILLRKPLATEAGGMGHLGADKFGRNLYRTTDSPGYVTLSRWVFFSVQQQKNQ